MRFVIGSLELGGSERQLVGLAARLDRERFETRIYCLSHPGSLADSARDAGIEVESLGVGPVPLWKWGRWTLALRRRFRESRSDIVHAFLFPSYALAAVAAAGLPTSVVAGIRSVGVAREGQWPFSLLDALGSILALWACHERSPSPWCASSASVSMFETFATRT